MTTRTRHLAAALALAALSGCTVGPDFKKPEVSMPDAWTGMPEGPQPPSQTTAPVAGAPDIARWWDSFNDPTLTTLVRRATTSNLDLAQAEARIRQARQARIIAESGLYPNLNASAGAAWGRSLTGGGNSELYRAGFDAAWEIDVFGGVRRGVEAAEAGVRFAVEDRNDVMITLAAEVATTYLDLRGAQLQLSIARQNLEAQRDTLALTQEKYDAGFIGALDFTNASAQVANTISRIPPLETSVRTSIYALGVLLGEPPATLLDELTPEAAIPAAPPRVPVGLPSELLERRPDIRRAEANLHAATARIGVATADLFPKFALNASVGAQSGEFKDLGSLANYFWSIGPSVSWNVFDAGRARAGIELEKAAADESLSAYKQTVLIALRDVETALVALANEQARLASLTEAANASREAVEISTQLYSVGKTDFLNVLAAQRVLFDAEDSMAQSRQSIDATHVALYKALGGGWDPQEPDPASQQREPERPPG